MISVLSLLYWPPISLHIIDYLHLSWSIIFNHTDDREIKHNNVLKMIHSQKGIFAFYWRRAASFSRILFHMYLVYFPVAVSPVAHMLNQIKIGLPQNLNDYFMSLSHVCGRISFYVWVQRSIRQRSSVVHHSS